MASRHDIHPVAPSFALRAGAASPVTLEYFQRQPIVLAFCGGEDAEAWVDAEALDDVRGQLRGLGAVLVMVLDGGLLSLGPDDQMQRWEGGEAVERARLRVLYGVPAGGAGIFVVDGDLRLRFAHVEAAPEGGTLRTIAAALVAAGRALRAPGPSPVTLSRRELVVSSLVAALAPSLLDGCNRAAAAAPAPPVEADVEGDVEITLDVNGSRRSLRIDARATLLDVLRERLGLPGTKKGCDQGQCGACTVLVGGRRVNACLTLAIMAQGTPIVTIEGLAREAQLHPLQAAFIAHDGFQCGYCTSGQIMSAVGMLAEGHARTDDEVREQMSGNICRCGAYPNIVAAIQSARKDL